VLYTVASWIFCRLLNILLASPLSRKNLECMMIRTFGSSVSLLVCMQCLGRTLRMSHEQLLIPSACMHTRIDDATGAAWSINGTRILGASDSLFSRKVAIPLVAGG
jgi:hypothetical protein